ncbi:MAG: DUF502 domain-containing protein [bacterium]
MNNTPISRIDTVKTKLSVKIRNIFLSGIAVFIPILITVFIIEILISWSDSLLSILPKEINPQTYIPVHGISLIIAIIIIFIMGLMTYNYLGQRLLNLMEEVFSNIPFVKGIYHGAKQITDAFTENRKQFNHVVLVEFPRVGSYAIGFVVGRAEIATQEVQETLTVFIPTVPNPTSGFFLFVKKSNLYELNISIEEAFKIILTMGVGMNKNIKAIPFNL